MMANRLSRRELFPVLPRILPTKVTCVLTRMGGESLGENSQRSTAAGQSPAVARERVAPPRRTVAAAYRELVSAQKPAARSAPAYSRFVNRRLGRLLAALCSSLGLSPNAVTAISAAFTFFAIVLLATATPSWSVGFAVGFALLIGYAFDSADGQVARISGVSSAAGEWLDHVVDATKAAALPLAVAIGLYRAEVVPEWWLLVPLLSSVSSSVLFFAMILTEQLRRRLSSVPLADSGISRPSTRGWLRAVLVLPMDYGVLCLSFLLLGALPVFLAAYTLITLATTVFLVLAAAKWFAELREIDLAPHPSVGTADKSQQTMGVIT